MKIQVDIREKNSLVPADLVEQGNNIEFTTLEIGDYVVGDIIIERKTKSDFIASIIDKRLFNQLTQLKRFKKKLLILESDNSKESNFNENALRGMILSVILSHKCPIIFTKDTSETAKFISQIAKKLENKKRSSGVYNRKKDLSFESKKQYILESIPGIGPKTAKELIRKFRTIQNIINAKDEELQEILNKKTKRFKALLSN